jgi:hypothetical protein
MNYSKIYYRIIQNRKDNPANGYVERHHIVPKSLGGNDHPDNLVDLTAREHFICHMLLTKMYSEGTPPHYKMVKAFFMMLTCRSENQDRFLSSKKYELIRIRFSEAQSISQSGSKNSQFGKKKPKELRLQISQRVTETLAKKGLGAKKKQKEEKSIRFKEKRQNDIDLYRRYYIIYERVGFDEFVNQTGYDKSQTNLVQRFKKLLPEFVPQNGKKRGK